MIETVTITRVSATDKKADGTTLKNKFGEFFRVGLQVEERLTTDGAPIWINGFSKKRPEWKIGDKVQVEITEVEYKGEKQLQFRTPKKDSALEGRVEKLEKAVFGETVNNPPVEKETDVNDAF